MRNHKVFISHSWQHSHSLVRLRNLLNSRGYFSIEFEEVSRFEPINSYNSTYIKRRLSNKIANSDVVLGLAGMFASYSDWMKWELDKAIQLETPIIGVIPLGQQRISDAVYSRSVADVRWNTESIISAIRKYSK